MKSINIKEVRAELSKAKSHQWNEREVVAVSNALIEDLTNKSRNEWIGTEEVQVDDDQWNCIKQALDELKADKPLAYITNRVEFYGLNLYVNESVLIPRPETEELVKWISDDNKESKDLNILDIGSGSGCIAIALAKILKANVTGIDVSPEAIEVAQRNAKANEVNATFKEMDILEVKKFKEEYQIMVCNPPYIQESERELMSPSTLKYEPEHALFVKGEDPLLFFKKVINIAWKQPTSIKLYFEINEFLKDQLESYLLDKDFINYNFKEDLSGKNRMLKLIL